MTQEPISGISDLPLGKLTATAVGVVILIGMVLYHNYHVIKLFLKRDRQDRP